MTGRGQVVLGILIGLAVVALCIVFLPELFENVDVGNARIDRLALGLKWAVVAQLPLIAGILVVAQQRFWSSTHADGSAPDKGSPLEINRRYLTNTLEQTVLVTVGLIALSITVCPQNHSLVPALTILYLLGRICFWVAYHINPYARAFGMVLSFAPTLGVYGYLLWVFLISTRTQ